MEGSVETEGGEIMIIYDPKTKTKKSMYVDECMGWLKQRGDSIKILPIRRDGYTPTIEVFKNKARVNSHCVGMSQSEVDVMNALLPQIRKTDYSFNLNKVK
jgi:hypothetical protein